MKKLILLIILCLSPSLLSAGTTIIKKKVTGGTWYYSAGSDSYPNSDVTVDPGEDLGSAITVGATGNITKISIKVVTKGTTDLKIMLMTPGGAVHECQTIANASLTNGAWNDVTLSTSLAVTSAQSVRVWVTAGTAGQVLFNYASGTSGLFIRGSTYVDFCTGTAAGTDTGVVGPLAVRAYVQ